MPTLQEELREARHSTITRRELEALAVRAADALDAKDAEAARAKSPLCPWCQDGRHDAAPDLNAEIATLRARLAAAHAALEQAQDCILGETPEDCSPEEAREDTLQKIHDALVQETPSDA
jgi:hypothetical protein